LQDLSQEALGIVSAAVAKLIVRCSMNGIERHQLKSDRPFVLEYWERDGSGRMTAYCSAAAFLKQLLPIERKVFAAIYQLAGPDARHDDHVVYFGCHREIARKAGLDAGVAVWAMVLLTRRRALTTKRLEWDERKFQLNFPLDGPQEMQRASGRRFSDARQMVDAMLANGELGRLTGAQVKILLTLARNAKTEGGRYFIRNKRADFLYEQSGIKKGVFYDSIRVFERKGVVRADRFPRTPSCYELVRPRRQLGSNE
jgi:hypothetical protein